MIVSIVEDGEGSLSPSEDVAEAAVVSVDRPVEKNAALVAVPTEPFCNTSKGCTDPTKRSKSSSGKLAICLQNATDCRWPCQPIQ